MLKSSRFHIKSTTRLLCFVAPTRLVVQFNFVKIFRSLRYITFGAFIFFVPKERFGIIGSQYGKHNEHFWAELWVGQNYPKITKTADKFGKLRSLNKILRVESLLIWLVIKVIFLNSEKQNMEKNGAKAFCTCIFIFLCKIFIFYCKETYVRIHT